MVHGRARIYIDEAFAYLRFGMVVFTRSGKFSFWPARAPP